MSPTTLDYFDWVTSYVPTTEVAIDDFDDPRIKDANPANIWTELDVDGKTIIASGWHFVNRIGYWITKVPVKDGEFVEVVDEDEDTNREVNNAYNRRRHDYGT